MEVAATRANGVADALARLVKQTGDFLETGARGPDQANAAASNHVGKTEADAVEDGGPAIRAHDEQALIAGKVLEVDLVFDRYVVGKEKHMQAICQRLSRFAGREPTWDGDDRQVCFGVSVTSTAQRARLDARLAVTRRAAPSIGKQCRCLLH